MRRILLVDWIVWLGLPLLTTGLAIGAWLTPQPWPVAKVAVLGTVVWTFWIIGAMALWAQWKAAPTFVLACGARVWTNGLKIAPEAVERAVRAVIERLPQLMPRGDMTEADLLAMYRGAAIEFVRLPIFLGDQKVAGFQQGHYMRVQWLDGFRHNAFVHESIHMAHETILKMNPDYKHELFGWWSRGDELREGLT